MQPDSPKQQIQGWRRIWQAASCSKSGLLRIWRDEVAFRQEVWVGVALLLPLVIVELSALERLALIAVWMLVLLVEILNTAIEATVDRIGSEWHDLSAKAKDLGSLAVLLSLILAAMVWGVILIFPLFS